MILAAELDKSEFRNQFAIIKRNFGLIMNDEGDQFIPLSSLFQGTVFEEYINDMQNCGFLIRDNEKPLKSIIPSGCLGCMDLFTNECFGLNTLHKFSENDDIDENDNQPIWCQKKKQNKEN